MMSFFQHRFVMTALLYPIVVLQWQLSSAFQILNINQVSSKLPLLSPLSSSTTIPSSKLYESQPNKKPNLELDLATRVESDNFSYGGLFESKRGMLSRPYVSSIVKDMDPTTLASFLSQFHTNNTTTTNDTTQSSYKNHRVDPLWEQVKLEARETLQNEPSAGPQLYTLILSQPNLIHALTSIVSHEIETQLIPATSLQNLFHEMLQEEDYQYISLDVMKSAMRSSSIDDGTALFAIMFHMGLHALVCHRLSHRLWLAKRTGLAYYIQSTVSRRYSTDIHPAAQFGCGIYLNAGSAGVVIGETAVVDHDVTILQGVTLGGTGKERGDRHPKVGRGAILQQSCSVLGNIKIGEGAIITAKSIVTKEVPPLSRVSGVPGKVKGFVSGSSNLNLNATESVESSSEQSAGLYGRGIFENTEGLIELERSFMEAYLQFWKNGEEEIL